MALAAVIASPTNVYFARLYPPTGLIFAEFAMEYLPRVNLSEPALKATTKNTESVIDATLVVLLALKAISLYLARLV